MQQYATPLFHSLTASLQPPAFHQLCLISASMQLHFLVFVPTIQLKKYQKCFGMHQISQVLAGSELFDVRTKQKQSKRKSERGGTVFINQRGLTSQQGPWQKEAISFFFLEGEKGAMTTPFNLYFQKKMTNNLQSRIFQLSPFTKFSDIYQ